MKKSLNQLKLEKLDVLCEQYHDKFNDFFPTEEIGGSFDELINLLEHCKKEGKTYDDLTGDYYEEGMDY